MAVLIIHQGGDWNQELYDKIRERVVPDPSDPPDGLVVHFAAPGENGGWRIAEVWESEDHWTRFRDETLMSVAQEVEAPPFHTEITELHYKIVSDQVTA